MKQKFKTEQKKVNYLRTVNTIPTPKKEQNVFKNKRAKEKAAK